jgi:alpha-acetolactate decarboxylase
MIKYRLRFKYQKENVVEKDRENNLNEILSDVDSIESNTPIRKPLDGEIIIVSGEEYKVEGTTISFEKNNDVTYYDFVVLLKRNVKYIPSKPSEEQFEEIIRRKMMEQKIKEDRYKKYKGYFDSNQKFYYTRPDQNFNI